ncbi:MAG TPA: histidine phosphatase family protein [Chloroflexota bacterium]
MLLHVVRHAESLANIHRSTQVDCDLSDLGRGQVRALADELTRMGVDRVLSSPYRRTLCTGSGIAQVAGVPLEVFPLLHEHHPSAFGADWPLMTRSELIVNFPELILPDELADRDWHKPPETDQQVLERMAGALEALEARFGSGGQRLVLVTHGSPAWKILSAFMGVTDVVRAEVTIANASITTLESVGSRRYVRCVNRTDHLKDVKPEEAVTPATPEPVWL